MARDLGVNVQRAGGSAQLGAAARGGLAPSAVCHGVPASPPVSSGVMGVLELRANAGSLHAVAVGGASALRGWTYDARLAERGPGQACDLNHIVEVVIVVGDGVDRVGQARRAGSNRSLRPVGQGNRRAARSAPARPAHATGGVARPKTTTEIAPAGPPRSGPAPELTSKHGPRVHRSAGSTFAPPSWAGSSTAKASAHGSQVRQSRHRAGHACSRCVSFGPSALRGFGRPGRWREERGGG